MITHTGIFLDVTIYVVSLKFLTHQYQTIFLSENNTIKVRYNATTHGLTTEWKSMRSRLSDNNKVIAANLGTVRLRYVIRRQTRSRPTCPNYNYHGRTNQWYIVHFFIYDQLLCCSHNCFQIIITRVKLSGRR